MLFSWDAINPSLGAYLLPSGLADTQENNMADSLPLSTSN